MSIEFPKDFSGIPKQILKISNGCSKDFQIISNRFPRDFRTISKSLSSDSIRISMEFQRLSNDSHCFPESAGACRKARCQRDLGAVVGPASLALLNDSNCFPEAAGACKTARCQGDVKAVAGQGFFTFLNDSQCFFASPFTFLHAAFTLGRPPSCSDQGKQPSEHCPFDIVRGYGASNKAQRFAMLYATRIGWYLCFAYQSYAV